SNRYEIDDFGGAVRPSDSLLFPAGTSSDNAQLFLQISGGTGASYQLRTSNNNLQPQFNIVDTVSFVLAGHQLKFVVDYRRRSPIIATRQYFQQALFSNLAH